MAVPVSIHCDTLRGRLLSRFAVGFERYVAPIVLESTIANTARRGDGRTHDLVKVRELRNFLSSGTVAALIDAPFLPMFILILFFLHPWYGVIALIGTGILLVMRVHALNTRRRPLLDGKIVTVAADALVDPKTGVASYMTEVELEHKTETAPYLSSLLPGMPVEIFVETGERTFAEYLLQPMKLRIHRAFRES
ncbi:hypothetical protein [Afipia massiliensis]|uniref:hypothetical protein n=1 Tax=Afipia massiliensis TaxID=211460 RepID=UPI00062B16AC|nr:hypothetical protein [Afipia massiliensis]